MPQLSRQSSLSSIPAQAAPGGATCLVCGVLLVALLGGSVIAIYGSNALYYPSADPCPKLELPVNATFYQLPSQWHWRYVLASAGLRVMAQAACPGAPDSDIYVSEQGGPARLLSRSAKTLGMHTVFDCHQLPVLAMHLSKDYMEKSEESFSTRFHWTLMDPTGVDVVALFHATDWMEYTSVEIEQPHNQALVAKMERLRNGDQWLWRVLTVNQSHPAADPRVLLSTLGMISFASQDWCNAYFWDAFALLWVLLTILLVGGLAACAGMKLRRNSYTQIHP